MAEKLQAIKGMNDLLPPDSARWEWVEEHIRQLMRRHGYQALRTPIAEPTALFVRGLGEVTDIVEKEMYSFTDSMNGDRITLRPEATAGMVRAIIEHGSLYHGPMRVWQMGPMFRHERPQKGRSRQFHQFDAEVFGLPGPDVDAELILLLRALFTALGLKVGEHLTLELNSLGQPEERAAHRAALISHFERHAELLDEDAKRRLHTNPLRILDSKNPAMQAVVESAPRLMDHLGPASRSHFEGVCAVLDAAGLPWTLNPRLVRGMDYYNLTVFEWVTPHLGAQATVCGGGRYDGLMAQLGGKPAPGVGFGLGMERLLLLLDALELAPAPEPPDAYAVVAEGVAPAQVLPVLDRLRALGLVVLLHAGGGSLKSQFKRADGSGARHALIFAPEELARGELALKPLRNADAAQRSLLLAELAHWAPTLQTP
jgi:histidyl-tRNA synthetase